MLLTQHATGGESHFVRFYLGCDDRLIVDEFLQLNASESFKEIFFVIIQLGAILAVVVMFWNKMFPFQFKDKQKPIVKKETFSIWFKVVVACIPGAVVTILFDNYIEAHLHTPPVIATALIFYGVAFILVENWNRKRTTSTNNLLDITYKTAFLIGLFQVLSIIPGTSLHFWYHYLLLNS